MPMTLELQELPTAGELGSLRHPQWFARARELLLESPKNLRDQARERAATMQSEEFEEVLRFWFPDLSSADHPRIG